MEETKSKLEFDHGFFFSSTNSTPSHYSSSYSSSSYYSNSFWSPPPKFYQATPKLKKDNVSSKSKSKVSRFYSKVKKVKQAFVKSFSNSGTNNNGKKKSSKSCKYPYVVELDKWEGFPYRIYYIDAYMRNLAITNEEN
ncbi:hypothetical protein CsatB_006214 [Cannabis sativa]